MKIKLKGEWLTKRVWLNGIELHPQRSLKMRNHSPDGFNWGYGGSGPAQLALAICLELFGTGKEAQEHPAPPFDYQDFKWHYIVNLPHTDFEVELDVQPYVKNEIDLGNSFEKLKQQL